MEDLILENKELKKEISNLLALIRYYKQFEKFSINVKKFLNFLNFNNDDKQIVNNAKHYMTNFFTIKANKTIFIEEEEIKIYEKRFGGSE